MQRRLYIDEAHMVLDIFPTAPPIRPLSYQFISVLVLSQISLLHTLFILSVFQRYPMYYYCWYCSRYYLFCQCTSVIPYTISIGFIPYYGYSSFYYCVSVIPYTIIVGVNPDIIIGNVIPDILYLILLFLLLFQMYLYSISVLVVSQISLLLRLFQILLISLVLVLSRILSLLVLFPIFFILLVHLCYPRYSYCWCYFKYYVFYQCISVILYIIIVGVIPDIMYFIVISNTVGICFIPDVVWCLFVWRFLWLSWIFINVGVGIIPHIVGFGIMFQYKVGTNIWLFLVLVSSLILLVLVFYPRYCWCYFFF